MPNKRDKSTSCRRRSVFRRHSQKRQKRSFSGRQSVHCIMVHLIVAILSRTSTVCQRSGNGVMAFSNLASSRRKVVARLMSRHRSFRLARLIPTGLAVDGVACFSSSASSDGDDLTGRKGARREKKQSLSSNKKKRTKKFSLNTNDTEGDAADRLAAAFDELARKEGFDETFAHFADDATFEDDFVDIDAEDDGDVTPDELALDDLESSRDDSDQHTRTPNIQNVSAEMSMDARIAAAQQDMDLGRLTVPKQLDEFARDVSTADLRRLGFKREVHPFGRDETPRKEQFMLITNAMECSACGASFQSSDEQRPGYIPSEKLDIQVKLKKIEEIQRLQEKAETKEWSTDDEIDWLIQQGGDSSESTGCAPEADIDAMADQMGLDLAHSSNKKVICKRCHGLQNFGKVDDALRPGWTKEPTLSQEKFRDLLRPIREKPAVIVALVDLFDFSGSVLPELDAIAGDNPVILAANKADLLPSQMGQTRAENWVRRELEYMGIQSIANIGGAVRLVSCKTGFGISAMLAKARRLADDMDCDVYVVGSANAGKSTLINHILDKNDARRRHGKVRAGNANQRKGAVTVSPLPGTTLKFIKVDFGAGRKLYDTPGLLVPGTLTQLLTPEELKIVVPKKQVEPITFRVASGKCVLVGGLARIEVVGDSKPFLFTFFVANDIKLHPTDVSRADEFITAHAGALLTPPLEPGEDRMAEIGEFESHEIDIDGVGWKEAAADITLRGLGWVSVTGSGTAKVKVSVPKGIGVSVRPPLMPFDVWDVASRYTGGRAVRKSSKSKSGKRRRGVGRN